MYTLIIVDDDEMIRRGMEKVIDWKRLGFQVRASFSDPSEAYQYLKENPVDVILTDMKMTGMSGLELIEKAKELQGDIRSVAMSGYDEFELARKALVLKAEDYLLKPISESDVEKTFSRIRQTLDEKRQSKAPREVSQKYADYETLKTLRSDLAAMLERGSAEGISELVQRIADIVSLAEERDQGYLYSYVVKYLTDYFSTSGTFRTLFFADWPQNGSQTQALSLQEMRQRFRDDVDELGRALDTQFAKKKAYVVGQAVEIIEKEFSDAELSLAFVANRLNVSYGYLSTIFSEVTGISFKKYLVRIRMEEAKKLLLSRKYHIYEIAEKTGYRNPKYFTDAFRKYYNMSPADYLDELRR